MAPTVDENLLPPSEFEVPLMNLAAPAAVVAAPDNYPLNGDSYPKATKATINFNTQTQQKKLKNTIAGDRTSPAPVNAPPRTTNISGQTNTQKPKRVRTGCLTCRERHLKCDETLPRCQNCQKSDRLCKRGVRLNFIDTHVAAPPYAAPFAHDWQVNFQDESRQIASEYRGGFERYPRVKKDTPPREPTADLPSYDFPDIMGGPSLSHQSIPDATPLLSHYPESQQPDISEPVFEHTPRAHHHTGPAFSDHALRNSPFNSPRCHLIPSGSIQHCLESPEEVLLMQVFVEEIGLWMDSMDSIKHFSHILPYHALGEPMLLNAFMACGARHLFLVNPSYSEDKALYYYNTSTRDLLSCLQDPNRDTVLCATTAVALNVYEIMCENAMQRMNHIAGARALIKECQWDATSIGIGGACFWLNVAMELLSCLHFNWTMAWDPDTWDINMNMSPPENNITGNEELWTHRMVYICAKIANFRSTIPHFRNPDPTAHDMRLNERIQEWNTYKEWCDEWARCVPRSMMPLGYVQPWQTRSKSSFPEVWLIQRTAIVGRLFYHTACCLLAGIHPTETENMTAMQQSHAHDICGIVAHVKDRGVASVSIRCLAIAAECLTNRLAQEEVLRIFEKIVKETGWQVDFLRIELMEKWGWRQNDNNDNNNDTINIHNNDDDDNDNDNNSSLPQQHGQQPPTVSTTPGPSVPPSLLPSSLLNPGSSNPDTSGRSPIPSRPRMPQGIVNPLMATADFSYENHPYQSHYVAPHSHNQMEYSHYESY
ncbi:C6 zinc finger domain-containing protein [Histoplasma capsulatum var. duboisii H88]|uniref:C6 zinc finger domain-containing protein n=1 Tax=Ajellomyces capsulatus (strain H88) TaxID=544711 RepID=A0A8A1LKY5_AJEC8|nr:C6 zinc finger domain-containing protein [Histoplasma capsulatum var. duboisii H88]